MISFEIMFADGKLNKYLEESSVNPWLNTPFEKYYIINNVCKGIFGEKYIRKYMEYQKIPVSKRINSGHDLLIDGYKTEVKISLASDCKLNNFCLNHISIQKDWERIIFFGVNKDEKQSKMVFFKKNDFIKHVNDNTKNIFNHQQGGKEIANDDYFLIGNFDKFFNLDFVYDIDEWKNHNEKRGVELWLS